MSDEGRPPGLGGRLPTQHLFGLDFVSGGTVDEVASALRDEAGRDTPAFRCVVTPNVDHLVRYRKLPLDAEVARQAEVVLPDGMPIVWAGRLLGKPLAGRLTGSDLFDRLWPGLVADAVPSVVLAPNDAVADGLAAEHPAVRSVVPPFFDPADAPALAAVIDDVDAAVTAIDARFVFVAISVSKTHVVAAALRDRWAGRARTPIVLLVGASPEFHLGLVPRAPDWAQRTGLEWLYRLAKEPRRLAKRYLVDDTQFAWLFVVEWWSTRRGRGRGRGQADGGPDEETMKATLQ